MNSSDISGLQALFTRLASAAGRVAKFSYTDNAYDNDIVEGVEHYDYTQEQNIPLADTAVTGNNSIDTDTLVLEKGLRAQGASKPRGQENHFQGRLSYNVNKIVDKLLSFFTWINPFHAHNAHEYDATATYMNGDVCYIVTTVGSDTMYQWFQCITQSTTGITAVAPPAASSWKRMREYTALPRPLPNTAATDLNNYLTNGMYTYYAPDAAVLVQHMSPLPLGFSGGFLLIVESDITGANTITQRILFNELGAEYVRTLTHGNANTLAVVQDWYMSRSATGNMIVAVQNGLWVLRVEDDGNLYLYADDQDTIPDISVDLVTTSPTYGHLIWTVED